MSPAGMLGLTVFVLLALWVGAAFGRWALVRRSVAWIRARHGSAVSLISPCVLTQGNRRRAGVLGLAGDVIVWRPVRFIRSAIGETGLGSVEMVMWEQASGRFSGPFRAFREARLLTIRDMGGSEYRFVLDGGQALLWDKILEVRRGSLSQGARDGE